MVNADLILRIVWAAVQSVLRVCLVGLAGVWLGQRGILNGAGRKTIAEALSLVMLPLLLFTKVSSATASIDPSEIAHWLLLPFYNVVYVGGGLIVGKLVHKLCGVKVALPRLPRNKKNKGPVDGDPKNEAKFSRLQADDDDDDANPGGAARNDDVADAEEGFDDDDVDTRFDEEEDERFVLGLVQMVIAFPNSGGLPLALVDTLCRSPSVAGVIGDKCLDKTVGYISLYIAVINPLIWMICPRLVSPRPRPDAPVELKAEDDPSLPPAGCFTKAKACILRVANGCQPPIVGALLGAIVGGVPHLKPFLLGSKAQPTIFGGAAEFIASAAVPMGIINLGASIASKAFEQKAATARDINIPNSMQFGAVLARLFIIPICGIALTHGLFGGTSIADDKPLMLVVMLVGAAPPAMQVMIFCQLFNQRLESPLSQLIVVNYVVSIFSLSVSISVILYILGA
ncbi:hypothetical protein M885DRAFT_611503 [Pelagophyceae sp. CCMP2097]|nr:hypothetical protein M885DRAFT_611503 [Pelagophyceae sp. CCMP2097]|mmetsp:Transcript_26101/g.93118  ORF Transcript_26101/g.93118 Transcript_26101/m.93118 type:complete len:456 (-) Transcript_26101:23-1390(-)